MDTQKIAEMAANLVKNAIPSGKLKVGDSIYDLVFNGYNYDVFLNGLNVVTFNTRSINQAKEWLKDYLNN